MSGAVFECSKLDLKQGVTGSYVWLSKFKSCSLYLSVLFLYPGASDSRKLRNSTGSTMTLEADHFYFSFLHNLFTVLRQ